MIYLASPYTARDSSWPEALEAIRYEQNLLAAAVLISRGHLVVSPIVLGHTIDRAMKNSGLPRPPYSWWYHWSLDLLEGCDAVYVLTLPGWQDSRGVRAEIDWAKEGDLPIIYINAEGDQILVEDEE